MVREGRSSVLLVDCPDQPGLIHKITGTLGRHGANILSNDEFVDRDHNRFFMRTEFVGATDEDGLVAEVQAFLPEPSAVRLGRQGRHRIVVFAGREHHCVGELLLRHAHGELGATILAVVSNHDALASLAGRFGIPFHAVSHEHLTREAHEASILDALARYQADYLVLAKYMRVLSPAFVRRHANRIVNIHHSFLPAFVGAHPYKQAFERGVKIIGATAHFVTDELDEGPIIAQSVVSIDHSDRPDELAQAGRDVEKIVLAKALSLVFDERVFINGRKTVVFS